MASIDATQRRRGVGGLAQQANPAFAVLAVAVPVGALAGALLSGEIRLLNYVHVMAGVVWTGIDLFMGLVIGPTLAGLDPEGRAGFFKRFTPKMTFLMPILSLVTIGGGIVLAQRLGYFPNAGPWLALLGAAHLPLIPLIAAQFGALRDRRTLAILGVATLGTAALLAETLPAFAMADPWIIAALVIVTLLSLVGFGFLLPGEIKIYFEIISDEPDVEEIGRVGLRNARLSGVQGALQLSIIFVMANLRF